VTRRFNFENLSSLIKQSIIISDWQIIKFGCNLQ